MKAAKIAQVYITRTLIDLFFQVSCKVGRLSLKKFWFAPLVQLNCVESMVQLVFIALSGTKKALRETILSAAKDDIL